MGVFGKTNDQDDDQGGGGSGLSMDFDERACPTCRRTLGPWEDVCPEDATPGVKRTELASLEDAWLSRIDPALLDDESTTGDPDEGGPEPDPAAGA